VRGACDAVERARKEYFGESCVDSLLDVVRDTYSANSTSVTVGAYLEVKFVGA